MFDPLWYSDSIQFARFIGELAGVQVNEATWLEMCDSMDLEMDELMLILSRGQEAWDRIKEDYCPKRRGDPVELHLCTSKAHEIDITLTLEKLGQLVGGSLSDCGLKEECPCCGLTDCHFDCDESQAEDSPESEEEALGRVQANAAIDGMESLILACACAGVDVKSPQFVEAIETAIDAIGVNYD